MLLQSYIKRSWRHLEAMVWPHHLKKINYSLHECHILKFQIFLSYINSKRLGRVCHNFKL